MPREKEETGYPMSGVRIQNMGFPEFYESLDDENMIDEIGTGEQVQPKRLFDYASLNKVSQDETTYTTPPTSGDTQTTADAPRTFDVQTVFDNFKSAVETFKESMDFFEAEPYSVIHEPGIYQAWYNLNEPALVSLKTIVSALVDVKVANDSIRASEEGKKAESEQKAKINEYRVQPLDDIFDETMAESETIIFTDDEEQRKTAAQDAIPIIFKIETILSYVKSIEKYMKENTVNYEGVFAFDHTENIDVIVREQAIKLGEAIYSTGKSKTLEETPEEVVEKMSPSEFKRYVRKFEKEDNIETVEILTASGHRLSVLKASTRIKETGQKMVREGTTFYIEYPRSDEAKALERKGIKNAHTFDRDYIVSGTASRRNVGGTLYVQIALPESIMVDTINGKESREVFVVNSIDVEEVKKHTAELRETLLKLSSSRPPGAWREDPESGYSNVRVNPVEENVPFSRDPRGAVPYISMPNVGDGLTEPDRSKTHGQSGDAEYDGKEENKVRDAYEKILKEETLDADIRLYATKRIKQLTR